MELNKVIELEKKLSLTEKTGNHPEIRLAKLELNKAKKSFIDSKRKEEPLMTELINKATRRNELLLSIKNNVQFFAWLTILGMFIWGFVALAALS